MEINHALAAGFGVAELQSAHAANAAHEGVLHHLAKGGGDSGVKGITTAAQNVCPHIRGAWLWADDNAFDLGHANSSIWHYRSTKRRNAPWCLTRKGTWAAWGV
jgi:hypothetical protein